MKKKSLYIFFVFFLISGFCLSQKRKERKLVGVYEHTYHSHIENRKRHYFLELKSDRTFIWHKQNILDSNNTVVVGSWKVKDDTLRLFFDSKISLCPSKLIFHYDDKNWFGWSPPSETLDRADYFSEEAIYKKQPRRVIIKSEINLPQMYEAFETSDSKNYYHTRFFLDLKQNHTFVWKNAFEINDSKKIVTGAWKMTDGLLQLLPSETSINALEANKGIFPHKMILLNQVNWPERNFLYPVTNENKTDWFHMYDDFPEKYRKKTEENKTKHSGL